jgi:glutathione peroxidase
VETDIFGEDISFETLRGKYVYMVNVASEDGTSMDNYEILEQLSKLRSDIFEIIIFPCNQFGNKEPRSDRDIAYFARKHGYRGMIMSKGDVNGVATRPTFQFLKTKSQKSHINGYIPSTYI